MGRGTHAIVEIAERKMGLYVVKEGFDTYFLKRHFGTAAGTLYDGGFLQEIDQKLKKADHVIRTDGSFEETDAQVKALIAKLSEGKNA